MFAYKTVKGWLTTDRPPPKAEKAILERIGSIALTDDRLAALAVAVASADDPSVTLEGLVQGVIRGEDVSVLLKGLLQDGSAKEEAPSPRKGRR